MPAAPSASTREPEYRAMNPMGLVPTLQEEDGWSVWEANTICRYLCNAHAPDSPLYPKAPRARAEVETWMDWSLGARHRPDGHHLLHPCPAEGA